ncbi:hypothetical protein SDC9_69480 [bioreactor metagenome]|uniref:ABC3 transporter permease protein domain-containing protein n=1 Tax=bioreactor metagenome TaxID=1076179 RepID=A0A644Y506_9ZZZZ
MITEFKQLSNRYLKANKKRTILTIIGIVLSVALISTIGLFFKSIQQTELEDAKGKYGSFHIAYKKISEEKMNKIINNPRVGRSGLYSMGEEEEFTDKLKIFSVVASDKALELSPYKPSEGRLPQRENEVAIEKWALRYIDNNGKVGEKIKIKDKEYLLVGLLENTIQNQSDSKIMILSNSNNINIENATLIVEINSKANLKKSVEELVALGEKDSVIKNTMLLGLLGAGEDSSSWKGIYFTVGIIISIVVVCTIAVIYNSFQISVVERVKQFGLLRAVGATPKQIRKLVFKEATTVAVIAIPLGLIFGVIALLGIKLTFKLIGADSVMNIKLTISYGVLAISALVGLISIYISAFIPAHFAGKISPLVAISSRATITKEKIKKRRAGLIGKVLGFEGTLASKNMKRNRKRYRITVFSIVISVVLFITFKSFMDMSLNISDDLNESQNIHFTVSPQYIDESKRVFIEDKLVEDIKNIAMVEKVYKSYEMNYLKAAINSEGKVKEVNNIENVYKSTNLGNNKTGINSNVAVYDDNSLEASKKYIESGAIDKDALNKENGVILIKKNRIFNEKTKNVYYGEVASLKVGDEIEVEAYSGLNERQDNSSESALGFNKDKTKKVKIMAILKAEPFNFYGSGKALNLISTKEVAEGLVGKGELKPISLDIQIKDQKEEIQAKEKIEEQIKSNPALMLTNNIDDNRKNKSAILMVQILLYGFVTVVSLIGSVNIINTLTTNIILRKKEFSTLKSIGLTQKGLKKIIVLEGLLYGVVGSIYGGIIGTGLSYLMGGGMNAAREFKWAIPWNAIGIATVAALIIGYLSVLAPLKRIGNENLIEGIREDF